MIFNCHDDITKYYDAEVRLGARKQEELRDHRDANRRRLERNLEAAEDPTPIRFVNQGSHAMDTIIQQPENDYDIDDGILFWDHDLKGPRGADKTPLEARQMVHRAAIDPKFATPPEIKKNCVRVFYAEGHHVDVPVYRQHEDDAGVWWEIASGGDWKRANPEGVTEWFVDTVIRRSPDEVNGRQMRRVCRLQKRWACKNKSWNMPSGLVISKLMDERYFGIADHDDQALYDALKSIQQRLQSNLEVDHPVNVGEKLTKGPDDPKTREMRDRLEEALEDLKILESASCTRAQALKAWKKFFDTSFWDDLIEEEEEKDKKKARDVAGAVLVRPAPWLPT